MTVHSRQNFDNILEYVLGGTLAVDSINVVCTIVGLLLNAGVLNDTAPLAVGGRITKATFKTTGEAWTLGQRVYWNPTTSKFTVSVTRFRVGFVASAQASAGTTADVLLDFGTMSQLMGATILNTDSLSNLAVETAFAQSLPLSDPNNLQVGEIYELGFQGIVTNQNATDTHRAKVKLGTTVILDTAAVDPATNDIFGGFARLTIRQIGAAGKVYGLVESQYLGTPGTVTAKPGIVAEFTLDTTSAAALLLTCTMTHSVQNAANVDRLDSLWAKRIN